MDGSFVEVPSADLHSQVHADLLRRIASGQFKPGDALPTEEILCRQYGVSRITVRRAMTDLVARRLVVRKRGVGSFVAGRAAAVREFHLTGFLDVKRLYETETLMIRTVKADATIAAALGVAKGAQVRHIRTRVRRDGEPLTVADAYTINIAPLRGEEADYGTGNRSASALSRRIGRRIERAEQELDAVAADAVLAEHLELRRGTPVMRARRVYFSTDNEPIQYLVVRYHPDRYRFIVDLLARPGNAAFETIGADRAIDVPPLRRPRKGEQG